MMRLTVRRSRPAHFTVGVRGRQQHLQDRGLDLGVGGWRFGGRAERGQAHGRREAARRRRHDVRVARRFVERRLVEGEAFG